MSRQDALGTLGLDHSPDAHDDENRNHNTSFTDHRAGIGMSSVDHPLSVYMGKTAAAIIGNQGWKGAPFDTLIGASGGPKWLILSELDQILASELLHHQTQPLRLLGSSIGTWRHACLSQPQPGAAIQRLQTAYLQQQYSSAKPSPSEVSQVAEQLLHEALGSRGAVHIIEHERFRNIIITARGRGIAQGQSGLPLVASMALASAANALSRKTLNLFFQRIAFCHAAIGTVPFASDFNTQTVTLSEGNLIPALKASGAIPLLMQCESSIPGATGGPFWDGGIIDYHFSLTNSEANGLILYPHFSDLIVPGWFDKMLPWRAQSRPAIDNLILMCPSRSFLATLPQQKIPDRSDFSRLSPHQRVAYWETCVHQSERLAEALYSLINGDDPLRGVTVIN